MATAPTIRFGDVHVDPARRELTRGDEHVHLEPQAFDLLLVLVRDRDRVLSKEELLDEVWGDQFVSESALTTRIKEIRRATGDDGTRQCVIKNVRGRGYRFVAEVEDAAVEDTEVGHTTDDDTTQDRSRTGDAPPVPALRQPRLVGRDAELERALVLLEEAPVLTIQGPGGVGKTTLARAIAETASPRFRDGTIVVRLSTLADPDDVWPAVRRAAGLSGLLSGDAVIDALSRLETLVVLDNCEHVLEPAARLASGLAERGGRSRVVVTSRERLGVVGEQVLPLEPLSPDDAVMLFVRCARAAVPGFELTAGLEPVLDRMLATLDRLPLAIEMAASRLHAISLPDLATLIGDRIDILRSPDRSADERHRSLDALVEWSEALLDEERRSVLVDCSVFAGAVRADDLVGVLGDRGGTLSAATDLVDRSLLVADTAAGHTGYRMLSTIRQHLAPRRPSATDRRHAEWFTTLAESLDREIRTVAEPGAHRRFEDAKDELRAAHRWARSADPHLAARLTAALDLHAHSRQDTEPSLWAAELAELLDPDDPGMPGVRAALAAEAANRGDYEVAQHLATGAAGSPDAGVVMSALETLADVAVYTGSIAEAIHISQRLAEMGREHGDLHAFAIGATGAALANVYGGEYDDATAALADVAELELAPTDRAWLHYAEGEALARRDVDRAVEQYRQAIALGQAVGSDFVEGVARVSLIALRARTGDPDETLAAAVPVLQMYRRRGNVSHGATALRNLIGLLVRAGHDEFAMRLYGALATGSGKSTYGWERELVAEARETAEARHGAAVAAWIDDGATLDYFTALDEAIAHVGRYAR